MHWEVDGVAMRQKGDVVKGILISCWEIQISEEQVEVKRSGDVKGSEREAGLQESCLLKMPFEP